jgi:hypothetical protein
MRDIEETFRGCEVASGISWRTASDLKKGRKASEHAW